MSAQDLIVFGVVLAAVVYLGRGLWASATGGKSCGGCSSGKKCGSSPASAVKAAAPEQLIQIGLGNGFSPGPNGLSGKRQQENSSPKL